MLEAEAGLAVLSYKKDGMDSPAIAGAGESKPASVRAVEEWPSWEKNRASHAKVAEKMAAVLRDRRYKLQQREAVLAQEYRAKYAAWQQVCII